MASHAWLTCVADVHNWVRVQLPWKCGCPVREQTKYLDTVTMNTSLPSITEKWPLNLPLQVL